MNKERLQLLLIFSCVLFSFGSCFVSLIYLTFGDPRGIHKERQDFLENKVPEVWVHNLEPLLPQGLKMSTEFAEDPSQFGKDGRPIGNDGERATITIRKKLSELGAYSKNGKIYDHFGKEIYFHWMYEPGGTNPGFKKMAQAHKAERALFDKLKPTHNIIKMLRTKIPR